MAKKLSRRDFIKLSGVTSVGMLLAACGVKATEIPTSTSTLLPSLTPLPTQISIPTATATPLPPSLRTFASQAGIEIGTESTGWWFNNPKWQAIVGTEFNFLTIDWGVYWNESEPQRANFDFSTIDKQVAFAEKFSMKIKGQALVFPTTLPDWLKQGNYSKQDLEQILTTHIKTLVEQYKGKISEWVVVNEPYIYPYRKDDIFYQAIGDDYIDIAFQAAREADPSAILIYNDSDNHSSSGITTKLTRQITQRLLAKGLIDGVGLQMHLNGAQPPNKDDVSATMISYGIPVYVTEFDVNLKDISGTQDERYSKQSNIYQDMLDACIRSGVCKSFTTWGIGDKYSWLEYPPNQSFTSPNANPTLFDDDLNPKLAYYAMLDVLKQYAH